MTYLILQILLFIILAAVVGFITGWLLRGHGLETRLLASENEWRVKQHILQNENEHLHAELDNLKLGKSAVTASIKSSVQSNDALPFRSAANRQAQDTFYTTDTGDQPLQRLRAKLALIEEQETLSTVTGAKVNYPQTSLGPYTDEEVNGEKDDLQQINGIDAEIEATLNSMGVYRYSQIAHFSADNIVWINEYMQFKGLIEENNWVGQARLLMQEKQN